MRNLSTALLLVALVVTFASPAEAACPCKVKGFLNALTDGKAEKARHYLADEVEVVDAQGTQVYRADELDQLIDWDIATGSTWTYADLADDQGTIRGSAANGNRFYELLGVGEQRFEVAFGVNDAGKIHRIERRVVEGGSVEQALEPVLAWARESRGEALNAVYQDGRIVRSEASARAWLELLEGYKSL